MTRKLQFCDSNIFESLTQGSEYWICVVYPNGKYTGMARNVKPFRVKLVNKRIPYNPGYWNWPDIDWDLSSNPKYYATRNCVPDIWRYGCVCDTESECAEEYNKMIDDAIRSIRQYISNKYSKEYVNSIVDSINKKKIK